MKWRVKVASKVRPWIEIEADYYRLEAGAVVFRNACHYPHPNQYPEPVHALAPGEWLQIKRVPTGK